jgi:hypothetical protein
MQPGRHTNQQQGRVLTIVSSNNKGSIIAIGNTIKSKSKSFAQDSFRIEPTICT